jgi:hypothetical protein
MACSSPGRLSRPNRTLTFTFLLGLLLAVVGRLLRGVAMWRFNILLRGARRVDCLEHARRAA